MDGVGVPELTVVLAIVVSSLAIVWPAGRICRRLGFSRWLGVVAVVPLANLLLLWYVAMAEWPGVRPQAGSTAPCPHRRTPARSPRYSIGFGATFGGWITIESSTLTMGAPPKTSGMT